MIINFTLNHEVFDNAMKFTALIAVALLPSTKEHEVLDRTWHRFTKQSDHDSTSVLTADCNVEKYLLVDYRLDFVICLKRKISGAQIRQQNLPFLAPII